MAYFLHLAVHFEDAQAPKSGAIETVLNRAKDWYRYAPNSWIIYTGKDPETWYQRLVEIPGMKTHTSFFICELKINARSGWLSRDFWKWVDKKRD